MEDVRPGAISLRARTVSPARAAGIAAVCVVVAVVAWRTPQALRDVAGQARGLSELPAAQREFLGARSADLDTRLFVEARRRIALDETYAVLTGPGVDVSLAATRDAVAPFARYYLLPRRQTPEPSAADWILSFGGDLDALGVPLAQRIAVAPGVELAQVARR
jgi:hypothetical protein